MDRLAAPPRRSQFVRSARLRPAVRRVRRRVRLGRPLGGGVPCGRRSRNDLCPAVATRRPDRAHGFGRSATGATARLPLARRRYPDRVPRNHGARQTRAHRRAGDAGRHRDLPGFPGSPAADPPRRTGSVQPARGASHRLHPPHPHHSAFRKDRTMASTHGTPRARTGAWFIGARGSVATTATVGALGRRAGLVPLTGSVADLPDVAVAHPPAVEDLVIGGHEVAVRLARQARRGTRRRRRRSPPSCPAVWPVTWRRPTGASCPA